MGVHTAVLHGCNGCPQYPSTPGASSGLPAEDKTASCCVKAAAVNGAVERSSCSVRQNAGFNWCGRYHLIPRGAKWQINRFWGGRYRATCFLCRRLGFSGCFRCAAMLLVARYRAEHYYFSFHGMLTGITWRNTVLERGKDQFANRHVGLIAPAVVFRGAAMAVG